MTCLVATPLQDRAHRHAVPPDAAELILRELAVVLASPQFCNSRRYPAFLKYVVEAALAQRAEELKERTLGIEVFGRRPDYDTNADTVVRYTAGEVRKRLALYYAEAGQHAPLRIHLPIGSYIPEFQMQGEVRPLAAGPPALVAPEPTVEVPPPTFALASVAAELAPRDATTPAPISQSTPGFARARPGLAVAVCLVLCSLALGWWGGTRLHKPRPDPVLGRFWAPLTEAHKAVILCPGSVIFAQNGFSNVTTAPRDVAYSFMSTQTAEALARLGSLLERLGTPFAVQESQATTLTQLRDNPLLLLGGYNNDWSMRLLAPLRFHFTPDRGDAAIVDTHTGQLLRRDAAQGYASADDYAIIARFHDPTVNGPVLVLAGLGRNGTEAATQFVASPQLLAALEQQFGKTATGGNLEIVLHSRVIEGRTGAPSVVAIYSW